MKTHTITFWMLKTLLFLMLIFASQEKEIIAFAIIISFCFAITSTVFDLNEKYQFSFKKRFIILLFILPANILIAGCDNNTHHVVEYYDTGEILTTKKYINDSLFVGRFFRKDGSVQRIDTLQYRKKRSNETNLGLMEYNGEVFWSISQTYYDKVAYDNSIMGERIEWYGISGKKRAIYKNYNNIIETYYENGNLRSKISNKPGDKYEKTYYENGNPKYFYRDSNDSVMGWYQHGQLKFKARNWKGYIKYDPCGVISKKVKLN